MGGKGGTEILGKCAPQTTLTVGGVSGSLVVYHELVPAIGAPECGAFWFGTSTSGDVAYSIWWVAPDSEYPWFATQVRSVLQSTAWLARTYDQVKLPA
jgi:hypothetical protein